MTYLKFYISDLTIHGGDFGCIDAAANICSQIAKFEDLTYGVDYEVAELSIEKTGHRYIKIAIREEHVAVMLKLKGFEYIKNA